MICRFNSLSYPGQVLHHFTFWEWMNNPFRLTNFYYRCRIMSYPVLILCTKDDDFFKQVCGLTTKTTHNREKNYNSFVWVCACGLLLHAGRRIPVHFSRRVHLLSWHKICNCDEAVCISYCALSGSTNAHKSGPFDAVPLTRQSNISVSFSLR